ncbi:PTS beta-glucoside transporter subunit IIA [Polycladomyces abyssicola]|uniref:PTS beta-glucoside transporter subunit IIA n=1 Tax=Polycladomyces abyssicola TaxID=1125966 RepID=A0A8D5ZQ71_9BACL|nr:PTS lactose/cellobiose transporter subunit IIA [Polycladomyces abyssicola]BCU83043.1 PTS beta-glucoside transporter subunit IIA [Polycladomyces abyssicola]
MTLEEIIFHIVLHGGNARGEAYEALDAAENLDFATAEHHLEKAEEELAAGHRYQTELVQTNSDNPHDTAAPFLVIHAQDHLMTAMAELNLIKRLVNNYRVIADLKTRVEKLEQAE